MKVRTALLALASLLSSSLLRAQPEPANVSNPNPPTRIWQSPLAVHLDTKSRCDQLFTAGYMLVSNGENQMAFDTLTTYIEQCAQDSLSYEAFPYLGGAFAPLPGGNVKWLTFRKWLFKVLYYNLDTNYYCGDVLDLLSTFNYSGPERGVDWNGKVAVEEYLIAANKCYNLRRDFADAWKRTRENQYQFWQDTVKDSLLTPFDTTTPTLQQIGFEILLGPQYGVTHYEAIPTSVLGDVAASPNPFNRDVEVTYTMNVPATLSIEVFNALGERLESPQPSLFTANGEHRLLLGSTLPSGTYYARFAVREGEVKTIKLVKQ